MVGWSRLYLLALDEALSKLDEVDKASAELVKLKYFGGLTIAKIAEITGMAPRSVDRRWEYARAWLHQELGGK